MPPLLSAIVLNYKTPKEAVRCVEALLKQSIADQAEILVIDNHSDDDSIQFIRNRFRSKPQVKILETPINKGYGQGNTVGIAQTQGKYLLIINPDNELEPHGAKKMIEALEKDPAIGIIGPQLIHKDGSIRDSFRTFPTVIDILIKRSSMLRKAFPDRMRRYLQHDTDPFRARDVDWIAGACLLMERDVYHQLGGFDPRFFLFFEDTDLCRRCWQTGKRVVYYPAATATDRKHRLSEGGVLSLFTKRATRIHVGSGIRYFWKWRNPSSIPQPLSPPEKGAM